MQKKNKVKKPWIKRGPLKTFLFFLGFSTVIWIFVQFSKQYVEPIAFPLEFINIPKDKIIDKNDPESLTVRVRDNGFKIARYKLFPPVMEIDVSQTRIEDNSLIYNLEQEKATILAQLGLNYENTTFLHPELIINFEQKAVKTVNVVSKIELGFAVGYSALEDLRLVPDTVRVSGPQSVLDTLEEVSTLPLRINNISNDLKGTVKLQTRGLETITFFQNEVNFSLRTDKFTEGKAVIPIELINVPNEYNVVIFPKELVVYYQVSLKDFDKIKPTSFKVVVDFKNTLPRDGFLLAQVVQKPPLVNNVRLSENKIQFVVKR